ncbi:sugar ABC transporter substrate-binding protein [Streptomyces spiroverticillatus]|uniref:Sugar ABC transporter substrate-binding protein n=1 Tax=Streptomyces finlayi TaxID=67296 RepID=A0A919CAK8_9ACTN|nr:ABC transporter substrate-binding protein [Streptomyces finlayi]GHA09714.1 sugar ABC transporter substrate-binding protein [Streptomyces spiroverticillatus]GHC96116.1 sugar ABC transporter substrate-binding protein [Streptomyces finlayi]
MLIAAAAAGALALTGCGGDSDGKKDPKESGGATNAPQPPANSLKLPDLKGEKLQVIAVWTGAEGENFKKVLKEFEKRTGATVSYVPTQDAMLTYLGSKISGGTPPDVALLQQPGALKQAVTNKWLKPVDPETQAQLDKNYSKGWKDIAAVDGTQYGVYYKAANKSLIWYNTKYFEDAGASEPKTWKDFLATAETISQSGVVPVSVGGSDGWTLTDWFENIYLSQAGPEKYDQLAKHEIKWTDSSVKDALTTMAQLFSKENYLVGGAKGAVGTAFTKSVENTFAGSAPKGAMVFEGDFVAVNIEQAKAKLGTDAKVFPFPAVGDKAPVVTGGDVAVALKDTKATKALMTFLASTDSAKISAGAGGFISPNKSVDMSAYPNDTLRNIAKALIGAGDDFRFDMSDQAPQSFGGTPGKGEWKILQDFVRSPKDIAGTQAKLETEAAAAYKN